MIKIAVFVSILILSACGEKEIVSETQHEKSNKSIAVDSSSSQQKKQETYPPQEFDRPILIPLNHESLSLPQHYYDSLHLVGWSDDGKLCLVEEPSMLSMSDEYQMKFIIKDALGNTVFQWNKPSRAQTTDAYSTLGLYLVNFISKMEEQGIKPLKKLELIHENSITIDEQSFSVNCSNLSDTTYSVSLIADQKQYDVASLPIHKHDTFGFKSSEYYAHFFSHDYSFACILIHETHLHTEGDVRHHLQAVIINMKTVLN